LTMKERAYVIRWICIFWSI